MPGGNGFFSPGAGGDGATNFITGSGVTYAGGGGGGGADGSGPGGSGGGGAGGFIGPAVDGTSYLGGGGGGGQYGTGVSGAGGSGVVILSVLTSKYTGITTGFPAVYTSGSYTIIHFFSSGSYTA